MSFIQKLRRVTLSITVLVTLEIIAMVICYKLGVLPWFLAFIGTCFISEIIALSYSDMKEKSTASSK